MKMRVQAGAVSVQSSAAGLAKSYQVELILLSPLPFVHTAVSMGASPQSSLSIPRLRWCPEQ